MLAWSLGSSPPMKHARLITVCPEEWLQPMAGKGTHFERAGFFFPNRKPSCFFFTLGLSVVLCRGYLERSALTVSNRQLVCLVAACINVLLLFAMKQEGYFSKAPKNWGFLSVEGALDKPLVRGSDQMQEVKGLTTDLHPWEVIFPSSVP